ncbi:unnamed protein product [Caenorhabditis sp. 36 PRJEB53466]|nr:unnamed protein product [Caenorhabditis sp. 36 PRJEB53466]
MERVRRDERKAAEEEQRVLDRQIQAENERRINTLRARADDRVSTMFGPSSTSAKDVSISDETGHVNLFQDLEREERKNLGTGNKEYEEEKAKEKKEWESKMGIQVYFADNTNDLNKKKEWYEEMPIRRGPDKETKVAEKRKARDALPNLRENDEDEEWTRKRKRTREESDSEDDRRKRKKDKKKKKKKRKHRDSSEERKLEQEYDRERKRKLVELRNERMERERAEKAKVHALLHPEVETKKREEEEKKNKKKYNSQFNPDFFRN